jgi:hypothetical protein
LTEFLKFLGFIGKPPTRLRVLVGLNVNHLIRIYFRDEAKLLLVALQVRRHHDVLRVLTALRLKQIHNHIDVRVSSGRLFPDFGAVDNVTITDLDVVRLF